MNCAPPSYLALSGRRRARDTTLYALCRLLDSLVDTVQWATQGASDQGVEDPKIDAILTELAKIPEGDSDLFAKHMVRPSRVADVVRGCGQLLRDCGGLVSLPVVHLLASAD